VLANIGQTRRTWIAKKRREKVFLSTTYFDDTCKRGFNFAFAGQVGF
jgi:hypothetical protein